MTTDTKTLIDRLRTRAPDALAWDAVLLHEAADRLAALEAERDSARAGNNHMLDVLGNLARLVGADFATAGPGDPDPIAEKVKTLLADLNTARSGREQASAALGEADERIARLETELARRSQLETARALPSRWHALASEGGRGASYAMALRDCAHDLGVLAGLWFHTPGNGTGALGATPNMSAQSTAEFTARDPLWMQHPEDER